MAQKLTEYVEAGYTLTPSERLQAARMLRLSVDREADTDQDAIDRAWQGEIDSRLDEILAGSVELVDADETYRLLSAEIASKRK